MVRAGGGMAGLERGEVRFHKFASPDKRRPVVVLTRPSSIPRLSTVTVAAITSTIRGVPSEVALSEQDGMKAPCAVNLHHLTTVQQDHLGPRVTLLSDARMAEICSALGYALGCLG
jgi:mRNA interferase MazF